MATQRNSKSEQKNRLIADEIEKIHTDSPDKGYRRFRDDLERYHGINVNDKRKSARICRKLNIKSTIKYSNNWMHKAGCKNPQCIRLKTYLIGSSLPKHQMKKRRNSLRLDRVPIIILGWKSIKFI